MLNFLAGMALGAAMLLMAFVGRHEMGADTCADLFGTVCELRWVPVERAAS